MICTLPQVLTDGVCVDPTPTCTLPEVLTDGVCVDPTPTCELPAVLTDGECVVPTLGPGPGQDSRVYDLEKLTVINSLILLKDSTDDETDNKIDKAIKHIKKWLRDGYKKVDKGEKSQEEKAVYKLKKILKYADEPLTSEISLSIDTLVDIERMLAQYAIDKAESFSGDIKVDGELEKVYKEMDKAQEELDEDDPDKAIKHFRKAYEHAQHAIKKAQ